MLPRVIVTQDNKLFNSSPFRTVNASRIDQETPKLILRTDITRINIIL